MATFLAILILLVVFSGLVLLGVAVLLPVANEAVERARIEREAQEASWKIHQQATHAFGRMLDATRQDRHEDA